MKKKIMIYGLIALLILGIATAGILTTRDKELPKEDKDVLSNAGVTSYTISPITCNTDVCDEVCIIWSAKFSKMCFTPIPYNMVCDEEPPIEPEGEWECPSYTKVQKKTVDLENEVKAFEDSSLNRILTREKINAANANTDKTAKKEKSSGVAVTIKEKK